MASSNQGASSSVPSDPSWRYDVFLSFRGETRLAFTAHLHKELLDQGITKVFLDEEELHIGEPISYLFSAIEQSRLAILVISQDYASSTWCLRELSKILECMEARGAVLPVFYSVDPSDVGKQLGTFGQAFTKLEERFKDDKEKKVEVEQWRANLRNVTKIKGWTSKDRSEPELIKEIVEEVRDKVRHVLSESAEKLVGIDSRLEQLDSLLDTESNDVHLLGICGLGGIGKTTLADKAYKKIYNKFEASSFLDRVREEDILKRDDDLANLKIKLSKDLMNRNIRDWNRHEEERLRHFLLRKKVLLILDDVDHINQLEKLCGDPNWFHLGSRIIITTRDEQLLIAHGVKRIFKLKGLNEEDALRLFSWKAFRRDYPDENYEHLSKLFVDYANGLPLALKVLGSLLHGRGEEAWRSELGKLLKDNSIGEIMEILKISYDGLDKQQKSIFLDIACFFKGMYKDRVVEILASCGFYPGIDIDILSKRSLITISDNMVWMHDLLQKMGQSIVLQQSQEPGERSRLWHSGDIIHVLRNNTGTAAVEGIALDFPESKGAQCHHKAFSKMFNLKLLKLHNVLLSKDLTCLPQSLRFFEWRGYSLKNLPPDFEPDDLVELSMCHSSIEQLWNGIKNFDRLKVVKLSHSKYLRRTPDFIEIQNLERLDLEGCESLVEIHPSIGVLKKLKFLNLKDCKSLVSLPHKIEMVILETLILSGCSSVTKIPEFGGCMNLLLELSLDETAIECIPSSIEHLSSLSSLDLRDCVNLKCLPSTIGSLKVLKSLDVSGCSKLAKLPQSLGKLELLDKIDVSGTAIKEWSSSIILPRNLKALFFRGMNGPSQQPWYASLVFRLFPIRSSILPPLSGLCSLRELDLSNGSLCDGAIPSDIGCLSSLLSLNLSGNNFVSLPGSISQLSKLDSLYLSRCSKLQQLPVLSSEKSLEVAADGCTSLKELQHPSNLGRLNFSCFNFINCLSLNFYNHITFSMLQRYLKGVPYPGDRFEIVIPGSEIPSVFSHQRMGSSVSVDLTTDWHNNKWMGYALCAVFQVFGSGWELSCVLEVNGKDEYPAPLLSTDVQPVSDHLWLFYVSRDINFGTEWQNSCNELTFSFRNSGPSMVKKCGVVLVYEQYVEEFNKAVTQSSSNITLYEDADDLAADDLEEVTDELEEYYHSKSSSNITLYEDADDLAADDLEEVADELEEYYHSSSNISLYGDTHDIEEVELEDDSHHMISNTQTNIFSSSPGLVTNWSYDVYLSFSREDSRRGFPEHLYASLVREGISTFTDHEVLETAKDISPKLLNAIEESRIVILILSRNYASSRWCLDELAKAVECVRAMRSGQSILPVLYDVDPSELRKQTGSFGEALSMHEENFKDNMEKVQGWRDALGVVGNLSGCHLYQDRKESEFIQEIIEVVLSVLHSMPSIVSKVLVGIDRRVGEMMKLCLGIEKKNDVVFIGIWGMGGIGKTTLARAFYEKCSNQFEVKSFLENVREVGRRDGLVALQERLMSDLQVRSVRQEWGIDGRIAEMSHRLRHKKVLIIIDDVDNLTQLEALAGSRDWFGLGSRIIITTRDEHLLKAYAVDIKYEVKQFEFDEALKLFSLKVFKNDLPPENYMELSRDFVNYANGLPLAIEVLGSFLVGKSTMEWKAAFSKLRGHLDGEIMGILQISFDALDYMEKQIFLDIACFFKGKDKDKVTKILQSFGFFPHTGIVVLIEKSLITEIGNKLWMHDLLQEMGWKIVRQECPNVPGNRSRLWLPDDIIHVLEYNQGTNAVQGIVLDFPKLEEVRCHSEAFSGMHRLRILQIRNVHMMKGPGYLSNDLRFLEWSGYPTKSLPQNFNPYRLSELNLCYSSIERLWSGGKYLPHLKVINVSFSGKLTRTPDFTYTPGLEGLILEGCTSLVEIHPSIAVLKRLTCLNLKDCRSLECLPSKIEIESLEILILSGCSKVKKIPEFVGRELPLLELYLDATAIEQLPLSVELLTCLALLSLRDCKNLNSLPSNIGNLKSIKRLHICGCSKLETLPDSFGKIACLEELDAGGTSICELPSTISLLENLEVLSLQGCKGIPGKRTRYPLSFLLPIINAGCLHSLTELNLSDCNLQEGTIPEGLGCLSSLLLLNLSKNSFVSLPKSIRHLSKLHNLNLESCKSLQKLPDLSSRINLSVGAEGSNSEERLLSCFNLINCFKLVLNQRCNNIAFAMLWRFLQGILYAGNSFETIIPGNEISELFSDQNVGTIVSMELPRQWQKNKWMGYALCAVFIIRRDLPVTANRLGKWKFGTHSTAHGLRCEVKPKNLGVAGWCPFFACSQELSQIESEHLWLSFVCGDYFGTTWQETCHNIEFTFKTLGTGMEVKKCGVRLIYEQDIDLIGMK